MGLFALFVRKPINIYSLSLFFAIHSQRDRSLGWSSWGHEAKNIKYSVSLRRKSTFLLHNKRNTQEDSLASHLKAQPKSRQCVKSAFNKTCHFWKRLKFVYSYFWMLLFAKIEWHVRVYFVRMVKKLVVRTINKKCVKRTEKPENKRMLFRKWWHRAESREPKFRPCSSANTQRMSHNVYTLSSSVDRYFHVGTNYTSSLVFRCSKLVGVKSGNELLVITRGTRALFSLKKNLHHRRQ